MKDSKLKFAIYSLGIVLALIGCSGDDEQPSDKVFRSQGSITVDGRERKYLLNLPPDYYEGSEFSLVIAMHGGGGSAEQFESTCLLTDKANTAGFIVVYPDGVESTGPLGIRTWNAGACCGYAKNNGVDDVTFISSLIDKLLASYAIDSKKVYATGHSNGGMMSYRLGCELSEKIAAIAPNGSTMVVSQPCEPSRAVPVLHMHSVLDEHVPYNGGMGSGISNTYNPPLDSVFGVWASRNRCSAPEITNHDGYQLTQWTDCSDAVSIYYYLTDDGGHSWPGGLPGSANGDPAAESINANDLLWDFFQSHQLP